MDERVTRAQRLLWETERLRSHGADGAAVAKLLEMAQLHEERARELLGRSDPDGWTDLYAAISARAEAGSRLEAYKLICYGRERADALPRGRENVLEELDRVETWVSELKVLPSLRDFARLLPHAA